MAIKKTERTFKAIIIKNTLKGGAWKASYSITEERPNGLGGYETIEIDSHIMAWANAGAAKRWIKECVVTNTNRKSIKFDVFAKDDKDKPIKIVGSVIYKQGPTA